MKTYQGIYKKSASVNGKPSWTSQSKAIWCNQGQLGRYKDDQWMIGNRNETGTRRGSIYTYGMRQMRSGSKYGRWHNGKTWKQLDRTANDFSIECIKGKGTTLYISHASTQGSLDSI